MNHTRTLAWSAILSGALLGVIGCGKPAPPPPGAPSDAKAPTVEKGVETGPQEPAAGASDSNPGAGSPQGEQGESK